MDDYDEDEWPPEVRFAVTACAVWGLGFLCLAIFLQWFFNPGGQDPTTPDMDFHGTPKFFLCLAMPTPFVMLAIVFRHYFMQWRTDRYYR